MIPLIHGNCPKELEEFVTSKNGNPKVDEFGSQAFQPVKAVVKGQLYKLQDELCVYCEKKYDISEMQVEHIKPKAGKYAHPSLCFTYENYAASCIQNVSRQQTCGQQKKDNILHIEPTDSLCNEKFALSTAGEIHPHNYNNKRERHLIETTINMLGLNRDHLKLDRKKKIGHLMSILKGKGPVVAKAYLSKGEFKHILKRLSP
jgi:uncharacterized protein (TIGR02646 family)